MKILITSILYDLDLDVFTIRYVALFVSKNKINEFTTAT